jgi:hypothetical protein
MPMTADVARGWCKRQCDREQPFVGPSVSTLSSQAAGTLKVFPIIPLPGVLSQSFTHHPSRAPRALAQCRCGG